MHQRLAASEARLTALEQENAQLRAWMSGTVASQINDAKNTLQSAQTADFRDLQVGIGRAFSDLQASIHQGVDGKDGQSIKGERGEQGDVTVIGETELAKEVIRLRIKLKEQHAAFLARLIEVIEANRGPYSSNQARIVATHMEGIKKEIERLGRD